MSATTDPRPVRTAPARSRAGRLVVYFTTMFPLAPVDERPAIDTRHTIWLFWAVGPRTWTGLTGGPFWTRSRPR